MRARQGRHPVLPVHPGNSAHPVGPPGRERVVECRNDTATNRAQNRMAQYILKRILLILPTLFGIMVINFIIVQFEIGRAHV